MTQDQVLRQLFQAIESHDHEAVLSALQAGIQVDVVDTSTEDACLSALQLAAAKGNLPAATALLERGASPEFVNRHGETALYLAALYEHEALVKLLSPLASEEERTRDLELAAYARGRRQRMKTAEYQRQSDFDWALSRKNFAEAKRLLPTIEINNSEDFGLPLMRVLAHGLTKLIPVVLEAGADPNLSIGESHQPTTPLGMATATLASWVNRRRLVNLLLQNGADVNGRGFNGATPLHEAACYAARSGGSLSGLKALLKAGADIEARDNFDNTPWMLAAFEAGLSSPPKRCRKAVMAILEKADADTSERASVELLLAAKQGDEQRAVAALAEGANPQARTAAGASALFLAVDAGAAGLVRILLAAGVDPSIPYDPDNPRTRGGITPLQWALEKELVEIEEILRSAFATA